MSDLADNGLRSRRDLHLARKALHVCSGVATALGYQCLVERNTLLLILALLLAAYLFGEVQRFRSPEKNREFAQRFRLIMRESEMRQVQSGVYFVAASILVILCFSKPVAVLAILYLAFGDPAAALAGTLWGRRGFANRKSIVGTLAGVAACAMVTALYCRCFIVIMPWPMVAWLSLIGGTIGGLAEALPLPLDDNFSLPVLSALGLCAVALLMHIPL